MNIYPTDRVVTVTVKNIDPYMIDSLHSGVYPWQLRIDQQANTITLAHENICTLLMAMCTLGKHGAIVTGVTEEAGSTYLEVSKYKEPFK